MTFFIARNNPFATVHLHAVPFRFVSGDWSDNLSRLAELNFRAAVVGHRGSGKSTLLRQLVPALAEIERDAHYLTIPLARQDHDCLLSDAYGRSDDGAILLVDGIERLSFSLRRRLLRKTKSSAGLVLAQHRRGRLPTWIRCRTSVPLLHEILADLQQDQEEIVKAAETAFAAARGNVRDTLRELYDQYAAGRFCLEN